MLIVENSTFTSLDCIYCGILLKHVLLYVVEMTETCEKCVLNVSQNPVFSEKEAKCRIDDTNSVLNLESELQRGLQHFRSLDLK